MDEKKFEEILIKNNQSLIGEIDKRMDNKIEEALIKNNQNLLDEIEKRMDKKFEENNKMLIDRMDKKFEQIEQKRIDDNFYFEHTYWEKISIIFDKLQLIDQIKEIDDEENQKLQEKVERNSTKLMSHDFRISKLEKTVNS